MRHLTTFRMIDAIARTGSIRAAAELMAQTPSAVQRRLQAYEDELGERIFERAATGVRLNAAGEMVIVHVREALAEADRLRSRLADLSGMRRGHVGIACSQALAPYFLPAEIAKYQSRFPNVTFDVQVSEHAAAARALHEFLVDLVLVFDVDRIADYDLRLAVPQRLFAMIARDHPLAGETRLRLRQCLEHPVILPPRNFGGRALLERTMLGRRTDAEPILQSNSFEYLKAHAKRTRAVTFQIEIGAPGPGVDPDLVSREIDPRDVPPGMLFLGQRRGRTLSVAASRFAEQIARALGEA